MRTHYDNLQVSQNASPRVIRAAWKSLAQEWHPDKHPLRRQEAERILKLINRAYEVLSNPETRRQHDDWIRLQSENQTNRASERSEYPDSDGRTNEASPDAAQEKQDVSESDTVASGANNNLARNRKGTVLWLVGFVGMLVAVMLSVTSRQDDWRDNVDQLLSEIEASRVPVFPMSVSRVDANVADVALEGSRNALPIPMSDVIEKNNVWWVIRNEIFVRLYNPSEKNLIGVLFLLLDGSCGNSASDSRIYLNFGLNGTPLHPHQHAVYFGSLPFDYQSTFGSGTSCGVVKMAFW